MSVAAGDFTCDMSKAYSSPPLSTSAICDMLATAGWAAAAMQPSNKATIQSHWYSTVKTCQKLKKDVIISDVSRCERPGCATCSPGPMTRDLSTPTLPESDSEVRVLAKALANLTRLTGRDDMLAHALSLNRREAR